MASQIDSDRGVKDYFGNSSEEAKYGGVQIQPQSFQDDVLRIAPNVSSARAGNVKITRMFRERRLRCHPTKTCYLPLGIECWKKKVREEFSRSPLMFGDFQMSEKEQDIYSGDTISSKGLSASVEATITKRIGKIKGTMYEVASIMSDYRMQAMGIMQVAWKIWERSLIPSLLANCGSWVKISKASLKTLNNLQSLYCRLIYSCPDSTPVPALRGEAGLLDMEHRIMMEKICLVTGIMNQEEENNSYVKQVLKKRLAFGWEGLTKEVIDCCQKVGLLNSCTEYIKREEVKEAVLISNMKVLKEEYKMEKLKHLQMDDLRYMQIYMANVSLEDSRLEFRYRTRMTTIKPTWAKDTVSRTVPIVQPAGRMEC